MGIMSQDNIKVNLTNPQRTYLWDVTFPDPVGGGDSDIMVVRCQSSVIPGRTIGGPIKVYYKQNAPVNYPGKNNYPQTFPCTFIEGEDKKIHAAIYGWFNSIVNDGTGIGLGDEFIKLDFYLTLVTTKGEDSLKIKLIGCFPTQISDVALGYEPDEAVRYSVTFSYDRWELVT